MGNASKQQVGEQLQSARARTTALTVEEQHIDEELSAAALEGADDLSLVKIKRKLTAVRDKAEVERRRIAVLEAAAREIEAREADAEREARKAHLSALLDEVTASAAALDQWTVEGAQLLNRWLKASVAVTKALPDTTGLENAPLLKVASLRSACELRLYGLTEYANAPREAIWQPRHRGAGESPYMAKQRPTLEALAREQAAYVLRVQFPESTPEPPKAA